MQALGRELWVVGDELLEVSSRLYRGQSLGLSAISIRNAAVMMMDGAADDIQGELETAAVSCSEFFPEALLQGLVDLFGYVELMPACAWSPAQRSLEGLSKWLDKSELEMLKDIDNEAARAEVAESLYKAIDRLYDASLLFVPGQFKMSPDPRDKSTRSNQGGRRAANPEERTWREGRARRRNPYFVDDDEEFQQEQWDFFRGAAGRQRVAAASPRDRLREEALPAVRAAGDRSVALLMEVDAQLKQATGSERAVVLKRLVKELHPDRNQGKEAEVLPVFRYVQQLRDQEKG